MLRQDEAQGKLQSPGVPSMTILISNPLCSFHYCGWPLPDMTFYLGSLFPSKFSFLDSVGKGKFMWKFEALCYVNMGEVMVYISFASKHMGNGAVVWISIWNTAFLTLGQTMFGKTGSSLQSTLSSMISLYIPASTMLQICKQISRFKGISWLSHCHLMVLLWLSSFLSFSLFVLFLWKVGKDRIEIWSQIHINVLSPWESGREQQSHCIDS